MTSHEHAARRCGGRYFPVQALINAIEVVRSVGGIVIVIAPSGSPVIQKATIPIEVDAR